MDQGTLAASPFARKAFLREWVELEWAELVARLSGLLDSEERELLPRLEREAARSVVQEIRYLRERSIELGSKQQSVALLRPFVAEICAHVQRAEHLGFRFPDSSS